MFPLVHTSWESTSLGWGGSTLAFDSWYTMYGVYHGGQFEHHQSWDEHCNLIPDDNPMKDACAKVLVSGIFICIAWFVLLGGSICGCIQGCCPTSCCSDIVCCSKMSAITICIAWPLFVLCFGVFASIKQNIEDASTYNRSFSVIVPTTSYHISFFLGLVLVLSCIGTVGCAIFGAKQLRDSPPVKAGQAVVGQPVVGQVVGKSPA